MTEPEIQVTMASALVFVTPEDLADAEAFRQHFADVLAGKPMPPRLSKPFPAAYDQLHAATDGVLRSLVALHGPKPDKIGDTVVGWQCHGCESFGHDAEWPNWPCETTGVIAASVGIDLSEDPA